MNFENRTRERADESNISKWCTPPTVIHARRRQWRDSNLNLCVFKRLTLRAGWWEQINSKDKWLLRCPVSIIKISDHPMHQQGYSRLKKEMIQIATSNHNIELQWIIDWWCAENHVRIYWNLMDLHDSVNGINYDRYTSIFNYNIWNLRIISKCWNSSTTIKASVRLVERSSLLEIKKNIYKSFIIGMYITNIQTRTKQKVWLNIKTQGKPSRCSCSISFMINTQPVNEHKRKWRGIYTKSPFLFNET